MTTREQFEKSFKRTVIPFTTSRGVEMFCRKFSAAHAEWWNHELRLKVPKEGDPDFRNLRSGLLVRTLCDKDGKLIYSHANAAEQLEAAIDDDYMQEVADAVSSLIGLASDGDDKKKESP